MCLETASIKKCRMVGDHYRQKPELMNWYISNKNVICPKHDGGELKGIMGKFGPCVRCSCGHFLKPEEI